MTSLETAPDERQESEGHSARWVILAVLGGVAFMALLDLFIVNIAIPTIGASYGDTGLSGLSWVLNAYAILFAALLVPAGRLADHWGRRRFLLIGVLIFTVASAACAAAPTLAVLIAARAVQAIGAALMVPTSLGLLYPAFPRSKHAMVVGVWAGVVAVAATAGPPVGGLLVGLDWRLIFIINVSIGLVTLVFGSRVLPEIRDEHGTQLPDAASTILLLAAVTLVIFVTVQGPTWGWLALTTLIIIMVAVVVVVLTVVRTLRQPHAVIERSLFSSRPFTAATVALFVYFVGYAVWLLSSVLFLQDAWRYSAVEAGLAIAPGPAMAAVFAINAGRLSDRFGRRLPAITGAICMAFTATYWILATGPHTAYATTFLPGQLIGGCGAGLIQAPLFAAAGTLAADRATTGSAVLNMARQVGSAFGVAAVVVVLGTAAPYSIAGFHHLWTVELVAGLLAAVVAARTPPGHAEITVSLARDR